MKILIADDETRLRNLVCSFLKKEGYDVIEASDGKEAIELYNQSKENIDLVILDVMMPIYSGYDVCREIKKDASVPVMILTAKSEETDEIEAFSCGADDYVSKPFNFSILILRVKSLLNRNKSDDAITIGSLFVDTSSHLVKVNDKIINLTPKEYELLFYLLSNRGAVVSRAQITNKVWEYDYFGETRNVDTHIKNLRTKLLEAGNYIKTVRGYGYIIE